MRIYLILSSVDNGIGENGASTLAEALKMNTSLQNLNLAVHILCTHVGDLHGRNHYEQSSSKGNTISEKGARALAEALKMNTSLQTLNLSTNAIGGNGASALAEALKINTSLQDLDLGLLLLKTSVHLYVFLCSEWHSRYRSHRSSGSTENKHHSANCPSTNWYSNIYLKRNSADNGIEKKGASALAEARNANTRLTILIDDESYYCSEISLPWGLSNAIVLKVVYSIRLSLRPHIDAPKNLTFSRFSDLVLFNLEGGDRVQL
ncbi:hypothetical protein BC936DRAFT_140982 [Jimgerdemannia flammicorona]|uniref:Uncharacterized protein n=1 Tax=Jimgerdemannia flammicorona TaxID=994334 RepID=A0A433DGG2_9FUNG|nr:hypothetical protein BC936DRAFT_140982 [Jimgerdemannia flammicorona]